MATYCVLRQLRLLRKNSLPLYRTQTALPATNGLPSVASQIPSHQRDFHTSSITDVNRRKDRAVVKHLYYQNHEKTLKHPSSPLVQLPDYSYLDGRPTEMTLSHKRRQEKNYNLAKQVVRLVEEVKVAQNQFQSLEEAKVKYEEDRKKSQLKEKGNKL